MEAYIMEIMKRASIFMILAQIFVHFRPSPVYEKYFKFLIGIMTMMILVLPIMELVREGTLDTYGQQMNDYLEEMKRLSNPELPEMISPAVSYQNTMEEEIKCRLNNCVSESGYVVERIELYTEEVEEAQGEAESLEPWIQVYLTAFDKRTSSIYIEKIDKIGIGKKEEETVQEKQLQKQIAEILEIKEAHVEVEIVE